jgi:membrane-bound metal-dependent hydrolase YbcI (DUF457 family)
LLGLEKVSIAPGITAMTPLDFEHYPITHSLVMTVVWSATAYLLLYLLKKDLTIAALIAVCVASHWMLDFITHRPDLPLDFSETTKVGLGLWNNKPLTVVIESLLFAGAVYLYARTSRALDTSGHYGFWGLIIFFVLVHINNIFGPPPPDVNTIAWAGHLQWLFVIWAYWVDKHRVRAHQ